MKWFRFQIGDNVVKCSFCLSTAILTVSVKVLKYFHWAIMLHRNKLYICDMKTQIKTFSYEDIIQFPTDHSSLSAWCRALQHSL